MILESTTTVRRHLRLELRESRRPPGHLAKDPDVEDILSRSTGCRLLCTFCAEPITAEEQRVAIEGRHAHRRTNPAGFEFELGCFDAAPGAATVGQTTAEHTWFAGFTWRFAICQGCEAHLGWRFEGQDASFYGLILNRLEAEKTRDG